jgi:hypothetical protein
MTLKLQHPFTAIVAGPTGSGKTIFTTKLIENANQMIEPAPQRVVWCYGVYQSFFTNLNNVEFYDGMPDLNMFDGVQRTLLVIDDLMQETDDRVSQIFTRISHHKNLSVLYLTQNLFYGSKQNRTMSLNSHYLVLFKNARDATQISHLAGQMYPGKSKFMIEAYRDATSSPFSYLLIDLKQAIEDKLRLRTNIFPGETPYVYVPK